jgi:hypothetical protein
MLDDVERRRFLIHPARKHAFPAAARLLHVELDEGARQPLIVPRRAGFTRTQPDDRILDLDRLAGLQREVANDAVALVEQSQHSDPIAHRRDPGDSRSARLVGADGCRARFLLRIAVATAQRDRDQQGGQDETHAQSGIHG